VRVHWYIKVKHCGISGRALRIGFTLIFEIQDTCACMNKPLPIICIITAQEDAALLQKCRDAGVKHVFVKPMQTNSLGAVLDAHSPSQGVDGERGGGFGRLLAGLPVTGGAKLDCVQAGAATRSRKHFRV
jgi:hypothetical protein